MARIFKSIYPLVAAAAMILSIGSGVASAQEVDFSGKTVRFLNNFGTGSSTDLEMRQLAPYVVRHLPGQPDFVVEAIPGGAGTLAAAQLESRIDPDGLTIGVFSGLGGRWASGENMPFDITRLVVAASFGPNQVVLTGKGAGFKTADDLANTKEKVFVGAVRPNTTTSMRLRLFLDALGIENELIAGYKGQLAMVQALQSDELDLSFIEMNNYLANRDAWAAEGVVGLMEFGVIGEDGEIKTSSSGLPGLVQVWEQFSPESVNTDAYNALRAMTLSTSLTRMMVLPPETPEAYAKAWETAFMKGLSDPEYVAALEKTGAEPPSTVSAAATVARMTEIKALYATESVTSAIDSVFTPE